MSRKSRQTFGRGRKFAIFSNVLLMVSLALTAAIIGTYLTGFTTFRQRFDLTAAETYSLQGETLRLLENLDRDVEVISVFDKQTWHQDVDRVRLKAMEYVTDLLQEYRVRSRGRLSVENLHPLADDERVRDLFQELNLSRYNLLIVRSGQNWRILGLESDLIDLDVGSPPPVFRKTRLKSYRVEEAISSAMFEVTQDEKARVYWLAGHGELSLTSGDVMSGSAAGTSLTQDNLDLRELSLGVQGRIPDDADAVLIIGPEPPFSDTEIVALGAYLRSGGHLLLALDPLGDRSLDGLLGDLGVEFERNIVCHSQKGQLTAAQVTEQWVGPANTRSPGTYGDHEITSTLVLESIPMVVIRSGGVSPKPDAIEQFTTLIVSHRDSFGDIPADPTTSGDYKIDPRVEQEGQRVMGAALEPRQGDYRGARVVIMPSHSFATNMALGQVPGNDRFLRRCVAWLVGKRKTIDLPPRTPRYAVAELRPGEETDVFLYTAVYLPLGAVLLGLMVWMARRR